MTVVVEVQALLALGRLDEAESSGQRAVARLGERVPQARSMILSTVAAALHEAGRDREAYRVLTQSVEVERRAFQELSGLQRGLERATLETRAARSQSDVLAAKNRELEQVVRELDEARATLEQVADRDWLTGLHNRRYLARELSRHAADPDAGPFSLAVLDLDHFKQVNDRFGHDTGRPGADARRRAAARRRARPGRRGAHRRRGVRAADAADRRDRRRRVLRARPARRSATSRGTRSRPACR